MIIQRLILRNLFKERINLIINLAGLTIALTSLLLILWWIRAELSFDRFHENADSIYRIVDGNPSDRNSWAGTPAPLGELLKEKFPEVVNFTRFEMISGTVNTDSTVFYENRIATADTTFFDIFSFPIIRGTKGNTLLRGNSALISESTAVRYFGSQDPVGKTLILNETENYEITGVFRDIPANSHIRFDLIINFRTVFKGNNWGQWNYFTYLRLSHGTLPGVFKDKTVRWATTDMPDMVESMKELNYQPLEQIHFQFNRKNLEPVTEKSGIRTAILVVILILVIACINFVNLSTLQSIERAKEIALRKILGESMLRLQFNMIREALLISLVSLILSYFLAADLVPLFNRLLESNISINPADPVFIFTGICLVLITGSLAGLYPAFVLSTFRPADLFRNTFRLGGKQSIRSALVILQFTISIVLMICLLMIDRQMKFVRTTNLGLNSENVVNIRLQSQSVMKHSEGLREEFLKDPRVVSASVNSYIPSRHNEHWGLSLNEGKNDKTDENVGLWVIVADKYFIKTMQITIVGGEELINNYSAGAIPFILNESATRLIKDNVVIGKEFKLDEQNKGRIIGIVKDFHFRSLHHKIEGAAIIIYPQGNQISVRINSGDTRSTLASLEKIWNRFSPDLKFDYYFLDEDFNLLYKSDLKTNKLLLSSGILSMIICCLGIFGIVSYSAKQRTKEIGIRKVNGSGTLQIIYLLSRNYTWWIIISFVLACPIAYYLMHKWLLNFAYATTISWWIFAASGMIAFFIAIITAVWQSWRVARRNPMESLRYE
jgi:putative ABC transport system permease protein